MSGAIFDEFRAFVSDEVARRQIPGVAVGLLHAGQQSTAGLGVTSVDNPLPVDENTLFQVGSITKTFTATAAMRLVDEGRLDLDRPVQTYLPALRLADDQAAATVTPRHLLTHTGGWVGDYFSDTGRGDDALARYVIEMAGLEQLTPTGGPYSYSNSGFSLLGRLIEVLTDEPFESALQRLVLTPLGLENSFLFPEQVMTRRYAVGHVVPREGPPHVLRPWHLPRSATAAGGLIASVTDQLRYASLHLGEAGGLSVAALQAMRQPLVPSTGLQDRSVGLAWNIGPAHISHGGTTFGQTTFLLICPDHGVALSLLTNSAAGAEVAVHATRWVLEHVVGVTQPETPVIEVDSQVLDGCVGVYGSVLEDLEVGRLGQALVARQIPRGGFPTRDTPPPTGALPLIRFGFYAPDRLVGLDPPFLDTRAEVIRGPGGEVEWLRLGGRLRRRLR